MDPISSIAIGLAARYLPSALGALTKSDRAEQVAREVIDAARAATGRDDPAEAAEAVHQDPATALRFQQAANRHQERWKEIELQEWREQNRHNEAMEGTAREIREIRIAGPLVVILRSLQRPCWCFFTLWASYQAFSGGWAIKDEVMQQAFYLMLALVLIVVLGERAVKNVAPLLSYLFPRLSGKKGADK